MKLGSLRTPAGIAPVAIDGEEVVELLLVAPELPTTLREILAGGEPIAERVRAAIASGAGRSPLQLEQLAPPIAEPSKFIGIGLNYADHVAESGQETPSFPMIFAKFPSCVVGPYDDVPRPAVSEALDYEGELGIVIGTRCRHVPAQRASEVIGGYLIANDLSIRDYQLRTSQFTLGKSFDGTGAIGPWIVTGDELDPSDLALRTYVNGELRQSSNTSNLIFDCAVVVELLSSVCTLEPGDIIATGTPGGVGLANSPPTWLRPGDTVRVEIDGIGAISNTIVQEPQPAFRSDRFRMPVGAA
jgi:2-keto-4-pentenoate hydratase/2-oxohepta-3-ene-1,7-dioic acid hydratase in catechol pathway